jgi:hypothetical protein
LLEDGVEKLDVTGKEGGRAAEEGETGEDRSNAAVGRRYRFG